MAESGEKATHIPQFVEVKGNRYQVIDSRPLLPGFGNIIVGMGKKKRKIVVFNDKRDKAVRFLCSVEEGEKDYETEEEMKLLLDSAFEDKENYFGKYQCTSLVEGRRNLFAVFARNKETRANTNEFVAITSTLIPGAPVQGDGEEEPSKHEFGKIQGFYSADGRTHWQGNGGEKSGCKNFEKVSSLCLFAEKLNEGDTSKSVYIIAAGEDGKLVEFQEEGWKLDNVIADIDIEPYSKKALKRQSCRNKIYSQALHSENGSEETKSGRDVIEQGADARYECFYWVDGNKKHCIVANDMSDDSSREKHCVLQLTKLEENHDVRVTVLQNENLRGRGFKDGKPGGGGQSGGSGEGGRGGAGEGEGRERGVAPGGAGPADEGELEGGAAGGAGGNGAVQDGGAMDIDEKKDAQQEMEMRRAIHLSVTGEPMSTLGQNAIEFFNDMSYNFEMNLLDPFSISEVDGEHPLELPLAIVTGTFASLHGRFTKATTFLENTLSFRSQNKMESLFYEDESERLCAEFRSQVKPTWFCEAWRAMDQAVRNLEVHKMEVMRTCKSGLLFFAEAADFLSEIEIGAADNALKSLANYHRKSITDPILQDNIRTLYESVKQCAEEKHPDGKHASVVTAYLEKFDYAAARDLWDLAPEEEAK